jgi:predicted ATPase/DNA-binding SARP family transcriptional activator
MAPDPLRIEVLGPIRVLDAAGRDLTPDGPLQRRLLALLVLRRGHTVGVDAAVEALWPERPPRDPVPALHNHVFRLRRGLPEGIIASGADGYRLEPSSITLDADELAEGLATTDPGPALLTAIDAAVARWSGPAYPELDDLDDGRIEAQRLEELRARAIEARAEARIVLGDAAAAIAELTALADAAPLRERPRALLMTALARSGRHVEALRVYDDFRRLLSDELGIEPSPALAAQQAEVLAGPAPGGWTPPTRLPLPAASLIGRDALVAEVTAMVETDRLVTLVGPGGVGKTRLAIEVGHRLRAEQPGRPVVMVELATAVPDSAVEVAAAALAVDARPGVPPTERVAGMLGDQPVTVILDNCEHVLDPVAGLVERLLSTCRDVRVVTTSRERLRVAGERVCPVPVLSWGGDDGPAVQLFTERAQAVAPDLELDAEALTGVAEIVRRLDGLPLAIELAAAQLHTHDIAEVAAGLDQRFSLLSSGYRTSSRHGSLSAAVSWSYGLLDARLQRTFADLSVYTGSFTAADAAAVCAEDDRTVTGALAELAERSLVMRAPGRRYALLETLRAFGTEQLGEHGRHTAVRDRHARHEVRWMERADRRLLEDGGGVIAEIDAAIPELRAALGWLLERGETERAGRLVVALADYGFLRQRPDVLAWAERVATADPADASPLAARVWVVAANAAWLAGDMAASAARTQRALALSEAAGAVPTRVSGTCGNLALFEGRLDDAVRWYERAIAETGDDPAQRLLWASTLVLARAYAADPGATDLAADLLGEIGEAATPWAAYVAYCAGEADLAQDLDRTRARARLTRAVELAGRTGASFVTGVAGASRASLDARYGDPQAAAEAYRELIYHWRRSGVWSTQWTMLRAIAVLLDRLGRYRDAAVLEGAVRATTEGHRIFGADETTLAELSTRLRAVLGDEAYGAARREGAVLDGDAAVEHALGAL